MKRLTLELNTCVAASLYAILCPPFPPLHSSPKSKNHTRTSNLNAQIPFLTHFPLIPLACSSLVGTAER
jgi:hypothetical protein